MITQEKLVEHGWPYVAVYIDPDLMPPYPRVIGQWGPGEKQVAIDFACEWWVMIAGHEPTSVHAYGEYSDDQYAVISDGGERKIYISMLAEAYRTDRTVVGVIKP